MPRPTPEIIARRSAILAVAHRHRDWTYENIAAEVAAQGHKRPARSTVHAIIRDHMPVLDPNFRKVNPRLRTYICGVCGVAFAGERGYSGANAVRCPKCRRRRSK